MISSRALDNVLTIDPGVNTGWAYWRKGKPFVTGVFRVKRVKRVQSQPEMITYLCEQLRSIVYSLQMKIDRVYIEAVYFADTHISQTAARSGSLTLLAMIIGAYIASLTLYQYPVELVQPRTWKGQLTDKAIVARVMRRLGRTYRVHEREAVALGLAIAGCL